MKKHPDILIVAPDAGSAKAFADMLSTADGDFSLRTALAPLGVPSALEAAVPDLAAVLWKPEAFDGLAALELVRKRDPHAPVVAIAETLDKAEADRIFKAGARDVVTRDGFQRLGQAIRHVLKDAEKDRKRREFEREMETRAAVITAEHDLTQEGILVVDRRGEVVSYNPRFIQMWGIPEGVMAARSDRLALEAVQERLADPEDFLARVRYLYSHRMERSQDEVPLKDGRIFLRYSAPLERHDGTGEYLGRVWFFRDVTAYRQAEQKVVEGENLFRALVDQQVVGTLIFWTDGKIAYVNPKFASVLGYSPQEVLGRNFLEFTPKGEQARTLALFREVAGGRRQVAQVESKVQGRGGVEIDIIGQFVSTTYQGKPAVIGVALDVTEMKKTKAALREVEDLQRTVVGVLAEGVIVEGAGGEFLTCNPSAARILGLSESELLLRHRNDPAWAFVGEDGEPLAQDALPSSIALRTGKAVRDVALGAVGPDGARLWLAVNAAPLIRPGDTAPHAVAISFIDITEHKLAQDTLTRVNRALKTLTAANEVVVRATGEGELLQKMCEAMVETGGYRLAWIGFLERAQTTAVRAMARAGAGGAQGKGDGSEWAALTRDHTAAEAAMRSGKPDITQDIAAADAAAHRAPAAGAAVRSRIALPLIEQGGVFGVMTLYSVEAGAFTPDEVSLLVQLAEDLSYGIVALRTRVAREEGEKRLRRSMEAAVQSIASTLEMRDPYTAGHQRDVARLATAMAREIGIPEDEIEGIYLAAVVHDIGKIRVPVDILSKPGPLTKLEYELIQTHAQAGYDIVKNVDFPWPVAQMILQHHERMDGSGYPAGLRGDQILPGARIISVADVVQAMSMRRPYRGAFGEAAALAEIEKGRGGLYDPAAVDACLKLFREKGFHFA